MTRRPSAALALPLALLPFLAAPASAPARGERGTRPAPAELSFWSWTPGVREAAGIWNREHPGARVRVQEVVPGIKGGYAALRTALLAGDPPDLAQIEYQVLPGFLLGALGGGEDGRVPAELSRLLPPGAGRRFAGWAWAQVSLGDRVFAVPVDQGPMALLYRRDVLRRHRIAVPRTWAEFERAAAVLRRRDPRVHLASFDPSDAGWVAGLAWQAGARWFRTGGGRWSVTLDDAPTRRVLALWGRMIRAGTVKSQAAYTQAWTADLNRGRVVAWPAPAWGTALVRTAAPENERNWAVAPLPTWGTRSAGNHGGSATVVFARSGARKRAAAAFAWWLSTDPRSLAAQAEKAGIFPAALGRHPLRFGGADAHPVFAEASRRIDPRFRWGPAMLQAFSRVADALGEAAATPGADLAGAMSGARDRVAADIRAHGIDVR
ncbi:ABC transporter substrate-binding protein [Bailinhaonella thermotolerans]|uniref:ABC transporter substrate-binding protein n=1 Tax=Bailinhaonella thermotolerans TaxID=1070861 RepID=UPI00192A5CC6|nr:extracellular solute-binding protein [Bailinhaonella thermotolerans]